MTEAGYDLCKMGNVRNTAEGTEQDWKCCDDSGDVFFFGTCEVNETNGLRLKAGTFCIIPGPGARRRNRKDVAEAYKCFERALAGLGVQQITR